MNKALINLEFLSEFTSSGVNGKKEFRVTELKALLRQTFRELYKFDDLNDMKEKESFLFGSTGNKSPIAIKMNDNKSIGSGRSERTPKVEVLFIQTLKSEINIHEFYIDLLLMASVIGGIGAGTRKENGAFCVRSIIIGDAANGQIQKQGYQDIFKPSFKYPGDDGKSITLETRFTNECQNGDVTVVEFDCKAMKGKNFKYAYIERLVLINFDIKNDSDKKRDAKEKLKKYAKGDISGNNEKKRFSSPISFSYAKIDDKDTYLVMKQVNYDCF